MNQDTHILSLKKNIEKFEVDFNTKIYDDSARAIRSGNFMEYTQKKLKSYESFSNKKLLKVIKKLLKENNELKESYQKKKKKISELNQKIKEFDSDKKTENSPRPPSCLRTSNSVPKKNKVKFSKEIGCNFNGKKTKKHDAINDVEVEESPLRVYRKITNKEKIKKEKEKNSKSQEIRDCIHLSLSLKGKKILANSSFKSYEFSPTIKGRISKKASKS